MSVEQFIEQVAWPRARPSFVSDNGSSTAQTPQQQKLEPEPENDQSSEATVPRAFDVSKGRSQIRSDEAAYPDPVPVPADPPSLVVDPSSLTPEAALPSIPIIISDDPTVQAPGLAPTPPATPELQFSYEEGRRVTTPPGTSVLHFDDEEQDRDE